MVDYGLTALSYRCAISHLNMNTSKSAYADGTCATVSSSMNRRAVCAELDAECELCDQLPAIIVDCRSHLPLCLSPSDGAVNKRLTTVAVYRTCPTGQRSVCCDQIFGGTLTAIKHSVAWVERNLYAKISPICVAFSIQYWCVKDTHTHTHRQTHDNS